MRVLAKIAVVLTFSGCALNGARRNIDPGSVSTPMTISSLRDLLVSATSRSAGNELDGREVVTRGRVNLRYRAQQYLLLESSPRTDSPDTHCLQLIIPEKLNSQLPARKIDLEIGGRLMFIGVDSTAIYPSYVFKEVTVHPYCTFAPGLYMVVETFKR